MNKVIAKKLIYPELSYKIVGVCFKVHSELGNKYQEKHYQRAVELELAENKIKFDKELKIDLKYKGQKIGRYFLDFLVEDKIVLELKVQKDLFLRDIKQVLGYLKSNDLKLGILVNFGKENLTFKRIINNEIREN